MVLYENFDKQFKTIHHKQQSMISWFINFFNLMIFNEILNIINYKQLCITIIKKDYNKGFLSTKIQNFQEYLEKTTSPYDMVLCI